MPRLIVALALASLASVVAAAPPVVEPIDVNVTNSTANAVPFQYQLDTSSSTAAVPQSFTVPSGWTAVVLFVSASCTGTALGTGAVVVYPNIRTTTNGADVFHFIVAPFAGQEWRASQSVFLPAAEGTEVSVGMSVIGGTGSCIFSVAGELRPVS